MFRPSPAAAVRFWSLAVGCVAGCAPSSDEADVAAGVPRDAAADASPRAAEASEPMLRVMAADKLGVLAGAFYTPAPGQHDIGFYGTDLGVSFEHGDEIRVLFGDTWSDENATPIEGASDDAQARIAFIDGDEVDAFAGAGAGAELPAWRRPAPALHFEETPDGRVAAIELYRGGLASSSEPVEFGVGKAVMTGFSNGRDGAFAIFRRDEPVECSGGESPGCERGFVCDDGLGVCTGVLESPRPCVLGGTRCTLGTCAPVHGGGLCQDRTSSMYGDGDEDGRIEAVVIEHEIGNADLEVPTRYYTVPWRTNKFTNPIAKPVRDFDPERADAADNDYRPADGSAPSRERVLIWGRPHSVGTGSVGRDARLYFAVSEMPEYGAEGPVGWNVRYLSALEGDRPVFSPDPADAMALDLDGEPLPESERYDIVDRTAITWVGALERWVMFYGGDFAPAVLSIFVGPSFGLVQRSPTGAIQARFARHPWGPWSAPEPVLAAGDPGVDPPAPGSEYASGGILHHEGCAEPDCVPGAPALIFRAAPNGFLYAPNIFDSLTEVREGGRAVDLYWNVSTWNPYQVILLRTRIVSGG